MQHELDTTEHHRQRSEFIRKLVQRPISQSRISNLYMPPAPKTIVQFWHDLGELPSDVEECVRSWIVWKRRGFEHSLLGSRHRRAFDRCYHPAMQADYFRLCYVLVEGGFYVDADDVCVSTGAYGLVQDGRLKLQPLCYDLATQTMVKPSAFLLPGACDQSWIFYFNNNPLIASPRNPVIEHALEEATSLLELAGEDELPEIQIATGPGNISKSIFDLGIDSGFDIENNVVVLGDWDSIAISKWPLSYRDDARNWRLSNQKRFQ